MNFSDFSNHTNPLFVDNKHLKLLDVIESAQLQLVLDFKNHNLPDDLYNLRYIAPKTWNEFCKLNPIIGTSSVN